MYSIGAAWANCDWCWAMVDDGKIDDMCDFRFFFGNIFLHDLAHRLAEYVPHTIEIIYIYIQCFCFNSLLPVYFERRNRRWTDGVRCVLHAHGHGDVLRQGIIGNREFTLFKWARTRHWT